MTDQLAKQTSQGEIIIDSALTMGDVSKMNPAQRVAHYHAVCESLGLNPLTRPLEYLKLNGKDILYARKDATDQLRKRYGVSITITARNTTADVYTVTARATLPDGRMDEEDGSVNIGGLKGDALANALMKAMTKAKRRATLSICGLGFLDEGELETIPAARMAKSEAPQVRTMADVVAQYDSVGEVLEPETVYEGLNDIAAECDAAVSADELKAWLAKYKPMMADAPEKVRAHLNGVYKVAKKRIEKETANGRTS